MKRCLKFMIACGVGVALGFGSAVVLNYQPETIEIATPTNYMFVETMNGKNYVHDVKNVTLYNNFDIVIQDENKEVFLYHDLQNVCMSENNTIILHTSDDNIINYENDVRITDIYFDNDNSLVLVDENNYITREYNIKSVQLSLKI